LVKGYKEKGKAIFLHGNRNRVPVHKLDAHTRENIATQFVTRYEGANFTHFSELLKEREGICFSKTTVRNILMEKDLSCLPWQPGRQERCCESDWKSKKRILAPEKNGTGSTTRSSNWGRPHPTINSEEPE
jgi:uncharacterized protein YheU (UPF0270 family)